MMSKACVIKTFIFSRGSSLHWSRAFLKYITSPEVDKKITSGVGGIPTVPGAESELDANMMAVANAVAQAEYFQLYYDQYLPPSVAPAVLDGTQGIFAGTITPEKCAQMVDEAYKKTLND